MSSEKIKKRSFISELRSDGRINNEFLNVVSDLTLEELITIKLEVSARMLKGKLYNFPLWYAMPNICRDALLKFVSKSCKTKTDMASTLGLPYNSFIDIYKDYDIK